MVSCCPEGFCQHERKGRQCLGLLAGGRARTLLTPRLLLWPEPKFVKVFWIPESENPDDDKIYFFFRESAVEATPALGRLSVSRVGQICRVRSPWATFGDLVTAPLPVCRGLALIPSY